LYANAPRRGGQHAERILRGFGCILQVDGYAGYNRLIAPDRIGPGIQLARNRAHVRRKFIDITRTGPAPIAEECVALRHNNASHYNPTGALCVDR
jgi:transposase